MTEKEDANKALYRLFDQAFNTAGDEAGRLRASADYHAVRDALAHITPSLKMTSGEWRDALTQAWDLGYGAGETMARMWGHTDYWEDEPTNPYRGGGS